MTKYFGIPFANAGDKTAIPDASQPSGDVSFTDGWTPDYSKDQSSDPDAKDVSRQGENYFKFVVTEALKELQELGAKPYDPLVDYPIGAMIPGSDNITYKALIKNGPGASFLPVVDPVGDLTGTWIDARGFGDGQAWADVSGSRTNGVTYFNTTGRPIYVNITVAGPIGVASLLELHVDGIVVARPGIPVIAGASSNIFGSAIVPNGSSYTLAAIGGTISYWAELR